MSNDPTCPNCGSVRRYDAPGGVCPACLLRAASIDGPVVSDRGVSAREKAAHAASVSRSPHPATSSGVLDTLAVSFGSVPHVLLRDTDGGTEPPLHRPAGGNDPWPDTRYRIDGEIARGGMGAVLKGRDPDLGRDVALKVLREDLRDNADMVRRFVEEAQIGGQLQHPGIVPIYELGTFADKRPFFSMKLVKGRTLAGMLEDRTKQSDDLPRFLAIFESVAQTIAYAHARGVIHRDLKPSNVMVGSFGEVQVMDWGLAKVLPRGGVVDDAQAGKTNRQETVIATARSGSDDSDLSRAGSVMGTPSYMAPEQARGEIDQIDERADVFALGSILCEILTGEPAFLGRGGGEIQRKAALGDLADATARLEGCGADVELVALATECLAREPEDRLRSAGVVAERVTAFLTGVQEKLRRAELDRVEERGRRRLTTVAAAAMILLGLAGGWGYVWNQQQKSERVAKTARAVDEALADAARLRGEAQAATPGEMARWAEALSAARRAEGLLAQGEGDATLRGRVTALLAQLDSERTTAAQKARQLDADRTLLTDLESIRGNRAEHDDKKRADAEYSAAFRKAGLEVDATEPAVTARWLAARSEPVELAGYLDDWAYVRRNAVPAVADWRRLVAGARAADPDPWRDALRAKVGTKDAEAIAEFRRLADDQNALDTQAAPSLILLARHLKVAANDLDRAARVLRRAVVRHPADFWSHYELSRVYGADSGQPSEMYPQPEEPVRHLTAAVAIRPASAMAHSDLGVALTAQGKWDEAVAEYREAIRLKPNEANAHSNLGSAFIVQGKMDEAVASIREAIRLAPDLAAAHSNLGNALQKQGKLDLAIAECREAIRLAPDLAVAHGNLGIALKKQGKLDLAIAEYREATRLTPNSSEAHNNLGNALRDERKTNDAIAAYREAIRLKPENAVAHYNLGSALQIQGKHDLAVAACRKAIQLDPGDAKGHISLGAVLRSQGKLDLAIAEFQTAIRLDPDFASAHSNLGVVFREQGKLREAIAECREAIRLAPTDANAHHDFGIVLLKQGKLTDAASECREAIRLMPDLAEVHNTIGIILKNQGKLADAVAEYREAIRLEPSGALAHMNLSNALLTQLRFDDAIAEYREVTRLEPENANAYRNLGIALAAQAKPDEAIAVIRDGIRLKPEDAMLHNNLAALLTMHPDPPRREPAAALEHARKANTLQPRDGEFINTLATAQYRAGLRDDAGVTFRKSMELRQGGDPYDWFFLAMIEHERGKADESARWFDKSVAWMKQQKTADSDLMRIWTEAAKLLGRP